MKYIVKGHAGGQDNYTVKHHTSCQEMERVYSYNPGTRWAPHIANMISQ